MDHPDVAHYYSHLFLLVRNEKQGVNNKTMSRSIDNIIRQPTGKIIEAPSFDYLHNIECSMLFPELHLLYWTTFFTFFAVSMNFY
jgi:hypothetical protein